MTRPSPNDLYRAAQVLIKSGQPVFPCRSDGGAKAKRPMTTNGLYDATLDLDKVKAWWKRHGTAALGIPTGIKYDVLDVDVKPDADGRLHLMRLQALGLLNGCKRVVRTPGGGFHLYFLPNPLLGNKARGAAFGLDVRATGGYVIAPPSYIETDKYEGAYVDEGETTNSTDDPLLWDLIQAELAPTNSANSQPVELPATGRTSSLPALRNFVSRMKEGERNHGLYWAVNRCIESGFDPHELVEPATLVGLGEEEVLATIGSALKRTGVAVEQLVSEAEALFPDDE